METKLYYIFFIAILQLSFLTPVTNKEHVPKITLFQNLSLLTKNHILSRTRLLRLTDGCDEKLREYQVMVKIPKTGL